LVWITIALLRRTLSSILSFIDALSNISLENNGLLDCAGAATHWNGVGQLAKILVFLKPIIVSATKLNLNTIYQL
jgi:hypothetical protein